MIQNIQITLDEYELRHFHLFIQLKFKDITYKPFDTLNYTKYGTLNLTSNVIHKAKSCQSCHLTHWCTTTYMSCSKSPGRWAIFGWCPLQPLPISTSVKCPSQDYCCCPSYVNYYCHQYTPTHCNSMLTLGSMSSSVSVIQRRIFDLHVGCWILQNIVTIFIFAEIKYTVSGVVLGEPMYSCTSFSGK